MRGFEESNSRIGGLFNQVLVIFLEEMSVNKCIRPLPVFCPDGLPIDLFKLFWVVKRVGGYDLVCRRNLWGFVAEECGLQFESIAFLKLIYTKYLTELDHWLRKKSSTEDNGCRVLKKLEFLLQNLEEEDNRVLGQKGAMKESRFDKTRNVIGSSHTNRFLLCSSSSDSNGVPDHEEIKFNVHENLYFENNRDDSSRSSNLIIQKMFNELEEISEGKFSSDEKYSCSLDENGVALSTEKVIEKLINRIHNSVARTGNSNGEGISPATTNHIMSSVKNVVSKVPYSHKRKRKSSLLSEMLNWLSYVAKHSDDPAVGSVPECSKWKEEGDEEFWYKVLLVREALLIKRCVNSSVEETSKQVQSNYVVTFIVLVHFYGCYCLLQFLDTYDIFWLSSSLEH